MTTTMKMKIGYTLDCLLLNICIFHASGLKYRLTSGV